MRCISVVVATLVVVATTTVASSAEVSRAALQTSRAVVNVSGGNTVISFDGSISGIAALKRVASVETVSYGGQGAAVCKINGVGNPAVPGECLGENTGKYWSYWRAAPGANGFSYSGSGAGSTSVSDGRVEGWNFGNGPPPFTSFCDVAGCAPPPPPPPPAPPPPPPAPPAGAPIAAPTPTAAPSGGGSSTGGSTGASSSGAPGGNPSAGGGSGSGSGGTGIDAANGVPGSAGTSTTSSTRARRRPDERSEQPRASGAINIRAGEDSGAPWGVVATGAGLVVLGAGALVIRSRRRSTPG